MTLVLGKSRKHRASNLGCRGWVTWVNWWFIKKLCERHDAWAGVLSWSCQSAVAYSFGLLNHPNSFCGGMFKLNAKFDADLLLYSLGHFERDSHTVHMLTQWHLLPPQTSTMKSIVHACTFQSTLLGCQVTFMLCKRSCYISNGWTFPRQTLYRRMSV